MLAAGPLCCGPALVTLADSKDTESHLPRPLGLRHLHWLWQEVRVRIGSVMVEQGEGVPPFGLALHLFV